MAADTLTTEVMRRLPEHLRPNPGAISVAVHAAVTNGWTPAELVGAALSKARGDAGPGIVVIEIRRLAETRPPRQGPTIPAHGPHRECRDATHETDCLVCYCERAPIHFMPVSAPVWWTQAKDALIASLSVPE